MTRPFSFGTRQLDLACPQVMGILNITADSFSDAGELLAGNRLDGDALLRRAEVMVEAGATLLDLGAESTRPGAAAVAEGEELERLNAALTLLRPRFDVVLSVDSSSPAVFAMAAAAGAGLLNDVRALRRSGAVEAARASGLPVCLMHMQGEPGTMQDDPRYHDVMAEVGRFLSERVQAYTEAGIDRDRILLDPGFGFGKRLEHNLTLLVELKSLAASGLPILVGLSRKRMLGELTGRATGERVAAGVAAAVLAAERGASIIRTHDVAATVDGLKVLEALKRTRGIDA